jgi:CHAD domain-containing protein
VAHSGRGHGRRKKRTAGVGKEPAVGMLLSEALRNRCDTVLSLGAEVLGHRSSESIHDFRVGVRRLIAAIDMVLSIIDHEPLRRVRRRLRRTLKSFNALRDLEIQRSETAKLARRYRTLTPLLIQLRAQERRCAGDLSRQMLKLDPAGMQQSIASGMESLLSLGRVPSSSSAMHVAVHAIHAVGFLRLQRCVDRASAHNEATLHRVRVALKKYRYTTEVLAPGIPGGSKNALVLMRRLQLLLGAVQDWVVVAQCITSFLRRRGFARQASMLPLLRALQERRSVLLGDAMASCAVIARLWSGDGVRGPESRPVHAPPRRGRRTP